MEEHNPSAPKTGTDNDISASHDTSLRMSPGIIEVRPWMSPTQQEEQNDNVFVAGAETVGNVREAFTEEKIQKVRIHLLVDPPPLLSKMLEKLEYPPKKSPKKVCLK